MPAEIKTIAVIGASAKGCAIAGAALRAGYQTILEDLSSAAREAAAATLATAGTESSPRLILVDTVEAALRGADFVIEAVAEELEMKLELFTIFDKFAKPNAILASSSDSLSITDMADMTVCAERCIGFCFAGANQVQLVRTPRTTEETVAAGAEVARRMGRSVVIVSEMAQNGSGRREPQPPSSARANRVRA